MSAPGFDTLALNLDGAIAEVRLARPERSNALNATMWQEIRQAFEWIDSAPEIRVAILSGEGRHFCAGIDLGMLAGVQQQIAAADAVFSIEEIDIGMVADVGTLQRLPRLIGDGLTRELAYTGRNMDAAEAAASGLVGRVFGDISGLTAGVMEIAHQIAARSPLTIRGTKEIINFSRDHSIADGLNFVATWNAAMLLFDDLIESMLALQQKRPPNYAD